MQRPHDALHLSPAEGDALIERLERHMLRAQDRCVLVHVVRWVFWLFFVVQETKLSLKRLRTLIFGKPSAPPQTPVAAVGEDVDEAERDHGAAPADVPGTAGPVAASLRATVRSHDDAGGAGARRGGHRPGQSRLAAAAYTGAACVACRHDTLRVGEVCPVCGRGRLYALPPGVEIRIDGNALLAAMRYELEGGVSNVDIDGNNALSIKAIGAVISTFETLPSAPCRVICPGSAGASGCSTKPCRRCGCVSSGPWHGKTNASGCSCGLHTTSSGIMG